MHSIVNLKTLGITVLCISGAVTLAAVRHFMLGTPQPIDVSLLILLIILFLPHYGYWELLTNSSFLRLLVVIFIVVSTLITIHQYWINIFLGHEAERVMVFVLVPGLQFVLYFFLWVIIRVSGGK